MTGRTVGQVISQVFPQGTLFDYSSVASQTTHDSAQDKLIQKCILPPLLPFDVFAVCGHMIQVSGLMGYFEPAADIKKPNRKFPSLRIFMTEKQQKACKAAALEWRNEFDLPVLVIDLWWKLIDNWEKPVRAYEYERAAAAGNRKTPPTWWLAVFQLLVIADEACEGIDRAYNKRSSPNADTPTAIFELAIARISDIRAKASSSSTTIGQPGMVLSGKSIATYGAAADSSVVCVQPKARVSKVGSSLRNLSRNLAITGPAGIVRCCWQQLAGQPKSEDDAGLHVLVVPLPYKLAANSFQVLKPIDGNVGRIEGEYDGWGNFTIQQDWLKDEKKVLSDLGKLLKAAKADGCCVNAIVYPELSLNFAMFKKIAKHIVKIEPKIEFLIAGSSDNCEGQHCNCVLTAMWENLDGKTSKIPKLVSRISSQRKHHRWRITTAQVADYGLSASLNPTRDWWESHYIGQRDINFFQFRESSVFSALICEDLARSDPVHEIVRSVAPNLLFAILMDGAQIPSRWSARYASTLADDPGTSVLTLTSLGLLDRVNENSTYAYSNSIGLWKDESGKTRQVVLPKGAKGVVLSLAARKVTDVTIDGRRSPNSRTWSYVSQRPVFTD